MGVFVEKSSSGFFFRSLCMNIAVTILATDNAPLNSTRSWSVEGAFGFVALVVVAIAAVLRY
jgi:hypothetical protein